MAQCHWPWILVRKAMKLLIVIMSILFIALLCFPSKAFSPDLRIRNCAFHEHVAYFYLTNPDIFLFITLTCRKFRIYWVGQKVLSSFPVSQEKPKWTFAQPNILFLYVYILKTNQPNRLRRGLPKRSRAVSKIFFFFPWVSRTLRRGGVGGVRFVSRGHGFAFG